MWAAALLAVLQPAPPATETPPPEPAQHARLRNGSISIDDYPEEAVRRRQHGRTTIRFTVDADGSAHDCRLWESSGSERLDRLTCGIVLRRFQFTPARDAAGRAVPEWLVMQFEWKLPRNISLTGPVPYSQTEPAH